MTSAERYPYSVMDRNFGDASLRPYLPFQLQISGKVVDTSGLIDTGSSINVLPYEVGSQLGLDWESELMTLPLTGILAHFESKIVFLQGTIGRFPPARLVFAWTKAEGVPVILGQVNFFEEYDVCLFKSRSFFEVKPNSIE